MPKTKEAKRWMDLASSLGCCVCRNENLGPTPAAMHHLRDGQGMSQRADDLESIPLCPIHHQYGGHGHVAIHGNKTEFERRYGTERELLEQTRREVAELESNFV